MIVSISRKDILKQLKADLIGKDSHRGVTLTYAWLANQFGHVSLGFIPTFILYRFLSKNWTGGKASLWSAGIVSITWLLFEAYNFLGPLLSKRQSHSKVLFLPKSNYKFEPAWKNIAFDTITDLFFFWFGAFLSGLICFYTLPALIVVLLLFTVLLIYPARYWYLTKMYLQIPQYPYQFRLSQWDFPIGNEEKKIVQYFLDNKNNGLHLFVFGSKGSGKTSLGVAIATELSIKHHACIYTTAVKLCSMLFEQNATSVNESIWNWRTSSALIIDDINPGSPIKDEIITPKFFRCLLDTYLDRNDENRKVLKNCNVIWVLGDRPGADKKAFGEWQEMLKEIGVKEEKILCINLPAPSN